MCLFKHFFSYFFFSFTLIIIDINIRTVFTSERTNRQLTKTQSTADPHLLAMHSKIQKTGAFKVLPQAVFHVNGNNLPLIFPFVAITYNEKHLIRTLRLIYPLR